MSPTETPPEPLRERGPGGASAPRPREHARKPYLAPRLTVYGRLAELTRFGGSNVVDSGGGLGNLP